MMSMSLGDYAYRPDRLDRPDSTERLTQRGRYIMSQLSGRRHRNHSWTTQEKRVLLVISRFFDVRWVEVPMIMTRYHHSPPNLFSSKQCHTRFYSTCKARDTLWQEVYRTSDFRRPSQRVMSIIQAIESILQSVGSRIRRRVEDSDPGDGTIVRSAPRLRNATRPSPIVVRPVQLHHGSSSASETITTTWGAEIIDISDDDQNTTSNTTLSHPPVTTHDTGSWIHIPDHASLTDYRELSAALPDTPCPPPRQQPLYTDTRPSAKQDHRSSIQPYHMSPGILFRTYTKRSGGFNTAKKFRAGFFDVETDPVPDPPSPSEDFFIQNVGKHLRRDVFQSIFISLSPSPLWVIHKAFHSTEDVQPTEAYIAVIDPTTINANRMWHAEPLLAKIKSLRQEDVSFWPQRHKRYKAWSELLVYGEVSSVDRTLTLEELETFAVSIEPVQAILRLDIIKSKGSMAMVRKAFFNQHVYLSYNTIIGFAKVLLKFGITPVLQSQIIEASIHEIMESWVLYIQDETIIDEAFGQWVYYYYAQQPHAAEFDVAVAREAFERAIAKSQETLQYQLDWYTRTRRGFIDENAVQPSSACKPTSARTYFSADSPTAAAAQRRQVRTLPHEDDDYDFLTDVADFIDDTDV